jgi:hypothetical protein
MKGLFRAFLIASLFGAALTLPGADRVLSLPDIGDISD